MSRERRKSQRNSTIG